jgi:hypothetical protein
VDVLILPLWVFDERLSPGVPERRSGRLRSAERNVVSTSRHIHGRANCVHDDLRLIDRDDVTRFAGNDLAPAW